MNAHEIDIVLIADQKIDKNTPGRLEYIAQYILKSVSQTKFFYWLVLGKKKKKKN